MSITAFTMKNVVAAGDDHLANLLQGVAASINSPENLPQSEKNTLIIQAALGFWIHRHEAYGFRRWKESAMHRINLETLLAAGVDVHEEARQLLLAAETKRRMLTAESSTTDKNDDKSMRANFSSTESDLLLAWARHTQAKTFRGVDDNTVREALRYLRFRQYQDGEAIFYQGDKGDVFYVLLEGSVGIYGAVKRPQQPDKSKRKQSNRALFTNAAVRTATAIAFGAIKETGAMRKLCAAFVPVSRLAEISSYGSG
ncbi:hypothetical protein PHYBOEH_010646 [Phytophthora boehmeriae]|uniref:Cyclic nucleotide-binding domain-containing protein n=1 Tax=Phytophthora boehmeriae TaxID=109152 RepID=A0A8T1WZ15_9STRA|nr:hypothetical protein PHYBOEH_010646 [Phytophthora boehmeriae]